MIICVTLSRQSCAFTFERKRREIDEIVQLVLMRS